MPSYRYKALDNAGRLQHGKLDASSEKAARHDLRQQALIPLKITISKATPVTIAGYSDAFHNFARI